MASFSWSDSIHALVSPCLACLQPGARPRSADGDAGTPQNRFDDLERLLADSTSSVDAETLSLHSNVGSPSSARRRRTVFPKTITLFGFHLFGRPPIHLPDDEQDHAPSPRRRPSGLSSSTLDSDAAPLDAAAIAARAQEEAARAERRAQRRARKEMRRAALALAMNAPDVDSAFEGFQGSGADSPYGRIPPPRIRSDGGSSTGSGSVRVPVDAEYDGAEMDEGDFDASAYTRRAPGVGSSQGGSDSRSRTSASFSQTGSELPQLPSSLGHPSHNPLLLPSKKKKRKNKSAASSSAASTSVASPAALNFPPVEPLVVVHQDSFEGFPDDLQEASTREETLSQRHSLSSTNFVRSAGFPSAGLGESRGPRKSDLGAFLASK